ncbi:hypothetical protein MIZ03_1468 [Rhodoferax lithotrophicus]|uniref:Uncharacterized protein n=1 Tax=Rhodoferax lithotrophicus TaxID=2798804 RepID=A0ABN6D3M8_9BURK|nr:hypothetical protein MIZ03_1468 [Rhodoferax sp. MIZ03]
MICIRVHMNDRCQASNSSVSTSAMGRWTTMAVNIPMASVSLQESFTAKISMTATAAYLAY